MIQPKILVVSEKATSMLALPEGLTLDLVQSTDIHKDINSLLDFYHDRSLFCLLFVTVQEYLDIYDFISSLTPVEMIFEIVLIGSENDLNSLMEKSLPEIAEFRHSSITSQEAEFIINRSFARMTRVYEDMQRQKKYLSNLLDTRQDQEDLINIGRALSSEKDFDKLLRLILYQSKKITGADAGSIYLVETDENGNKRLRFKYSHTFSREIPLEEFTMDINTSSIAGYVAVTGEVLNIPEVHNLPEGAPYSFNASFDLENHYVSRSMLVLPMRNHIDEIIGVIQLINSKEYLDKSEDNESEAFSVVLATAEDFDKYVVPFDTKYNSLLEAIASQAAIAIQNNNFIRQIQHQFEEFVRASVSAIESRDPATSGHSFRVAALCTAMARAINDCREGYFRDISFTDNEISELEYAALLHDFGKVYIDLAIFRKAKKLYPRDFDNLILRFEFLYRTLELQFANRLLRLKEEKGESSSGIEKLEKEREKALGCISEAMELVSKLNEPTIMDLDPEKIYDSIEKKIECFQCLTIEGEPLSVLTDDDRINLTIKRGSLNPEERKEIESHVIHTYNFVSRIPWPAEYRRIPEIALHHHEQLDGSGYPEGLVGRESASLQSRIMTVADIYDALAAKDRPYKKALPIEKVLSILKEEAARGKLDPDVVDIFISRGIYKEIEPDSFKTV